MSDEVRYIQRGDTIRAIDAATGAVAFHKVDRRYGADIIAIKISKEEAGADPILLRVRSG